MFHKKQIFSFFSDLCDQFIATHAEKFLLLIVYYWHLILFTDSAQYRTNFQNVIYRFTPEKYLEVKEETDLITLHIINSPAEVRKHFC